MNEDMLRAMVREAVTRRLAVQGAAPAAAEPATRAMQASHFRYVLPESDGPCLIEPSVQCNHCGYCQSHGH